MFSMAESQLSLIVTCLPSLGPLLRRIWSGRSKDPENELRMNYFISSNLTSPEEILQQHSLGLGLNTETMAYGGWEDPNATESQHCEYTSPHVIQVKSTWSVDQKA